LNGIYLFSLKYILLNLFSQGVIEYEKYIQNCADRFKKVIEHFFIISFHVSFNYQLLVVNY